MQSRGKCDVPRRSPVTLLRLAAFALALGLPSSRRFEGRSCLGWCPNTRLRGTCPAGRCRARRRSRFAGAIAPNLRSLLHGSAHALRFAFFFRLRQLDRGKRERNRQLIGEPLLRFELSLQPGKRLFGDALNEESAQDAIRRAAVRSPASGVRVRASRIPAHLRRAVPRISKPLPSRASHSRPLANGESEARAFPCRSGIGKAMSGEHPRARTTS